MIETNCPQCGNKLFHNQGVSQKNGKPYENYKCGKCSYIKWVDSPAGQQTPTQGNSTAGFEKVSYQTELLVLNEILAELKKIEENTRPFEKLKADIPVVEEDYDQFRKD